LSLILVITAIVVRTRNSSNIARYESLSRIFSENLEDNTEEFVVVDGVHFRLEQLFIRGMSKDEVISIMLRHGWVTDPNSFSHLQFPRDEMVSATVVDVSGGLCRISIEERLGTYESLKHAL
jgi:hypothetical protein